MAAFVAPHVCAQARASVGAASPLIVVQGVTLIDGTGAPARRNVTIVISDRHIVAVGREGEVKVPHGAMRVDARGLVAIPGLWDMHVHLTNRDELWFYLTHGITSVRDMGSEISVVKPWRDSIALGLLAGPRIKTAGPVVETQESVDGIRKEENQYGESLGRSWRVIVPTPEAAQHAVDSIASLGVDFLKGRTYASSATFFAVAAAARRRGIMFVGHPPFGLPITPEQAADSGLRTFEHGYFPDRVDTLSASALTHVVNNLLRNRVQLVPTLVAWEGRRLPADSVARLRLSTACGALPAGVFAEVSRRWRIYVLERTSAPESPAGLKAWNDALDRNVRDLETLHHAGVPILPGTDVAAFICPETALNQELELFVSGLRMTPAEALQSATRQPAELFNLERSLGTIERGKLADIVLLDASPLIDIHNLRRVHAVIANGIYFSHEALSR